jgi:hypothetical protein
MTSPEYRRTSSDLPACENCGMRADDLIEHNGVYWCPSVQRCEYNENIGWINADIQESIDAELRGER